MKTKYQEVVDKTIKAGGTVKGFRVFKRTMELFIGDRKKQVLNPLNRC